MTNFQWWQNEAAKDNLVMCMLCFESKPIEKMWTDENGNTWDVCTDCHNEEQRIMKERGLI